MSNAIVIYRGKPKTNSWARWMVNRTMRQNKNNLVAVVGKTGSGKTYSAISICEIMSKMDGVPFDVDKHVVFSLNELMDLINSGELRRGNKIVCDEFQCSISAREFQSKANKVFNYVLSTFRHLNLTLFFCTPFETLLDKNTRRLFHARFETMSIDRNNQTCRLKPRFLEYSDYKTEPYRKQLIVMFKDGNRNKSRKLFYWDIPRPSKENEIIYEKKKIDFTSRLNKNISLELEKGNSLTSKRVEEMTIRKPLTQRQKEVAQLLSQHSAEEVADILSIFLSSVYGHKTDIEKKGYIFKPIWENKRIIRYEIEGIAQNSGIDAEKSQV